MRRTTLRRLAAVSLLALAALAEERPRYGGTLRIQMRQAVFSLDPADGKDITPARQRLTFLIFDRLTEIDDRGRVQPALAANWNSDVERRTWRFFLRPGVSFHDGTPLTAAHVAGLFTGDPRWQVRAGNGTVVFECANPIADLPAVLAGARYSILLRGPENVQGTGPFKIAAWQPGRQLSLAANLDHFAGRPFLDAVEVVMGGTLREQLIDMRLGAEDVAEVDLEQARRLSTAGQRIAAAAQSRLLALVFRRGPPAVRELLRASLDREAIHAAILRRSGAPATSLLPQWLTGYSLLFRETTDTARLQKLKSEAAQGRLQPLYLAYDPGEPALKAVAERIAVNARDVGLTVQVFAEKNPSANARADMFLVVLPLGSVNATQALVQLAESARLDQAELLSAAGPEALFAAEQGLLSGSRLIPIAHLPAPAWLSARVRAWKPAPDGSWRLEEVWLESNK